MNGDDEYTGEWDEWRRLIIHEIKRLDAKIENINERGITMQSDILRLKLVSATWGAICGILITLVAQKIITILAGI